MHRRRAGLPCLSFRSGCNTIVILLVRRRQEHTDEGPQYGVAAVAEEWSAYKIRWQRASSRPADLCVEDCRGGIAPPTNDVGLHLARAGGGGARQGDGADCRAAGLLCDAIYRSFSEKGNPTLKSTLAMMQALGIKLTAKTPSAASGRNPPFARPPQRAKTSRRGPRTTPASQDRSPGTPESQRRMGHPLLREEQDSKNLGWATGGWRSHYSILGAPFIAVLSRWVG